MKSHYTTLGVEQGATPEEIKAAYRKLAMRWHPDKNRGNEREATRVFKSLSEAYAVLSDKRSRTQYDQSLRSGETTHKQGTDYAQQEQRGRDFAEQAAEMSFANFLIKLEEILRRGIDKVVEGFERYGNYSRAWNKEWTQSQRLIGEAHTKIDKQNTNKRDLAIILKVGGCLGAIFVGVVLIQASACISWYALVFLIPLMVMGAGSSMTDEIKKEKDSATDAHQKDLPKMGDFFKGFFD